MKKLSEKMLSMLERLAEMFPRQHYQTELERFLSSKRPTNAAEVDYWTMRFQQEEGRHWGRGL